MEKILFYSTKDAFGEFSNFYTGYEIFLDGEWWPSTEHYFQAQKFADPKYRRMIRKAKNPWTAAQLGRTRELPLVKGWESKKDAFMYRAVYEKFFSHEYLNYLLLSTGEAQIIEHTNRDSYWGDGGDGSGKNRLGKILMRVRKELREL